MPRILITPDSFVIIRNGIHCRNVTAIFGAELNQLQLVLYVVDIKAA